MDAAGGRLQIVQADALEVDLTDLGPAPRRIVANLPYNVSTALLVRWLHQADEIADMVLMFQKEVADRLAAQPRSKDYGRLSVLGPACLHRPAPVRRGPLGLRPAAQGHLLGGAAASPTRRPPAGRFEGPGEGHRGGLRPTPQDAARRTGRRCLPILWPS